MHRTRVQAVSDDLGTDTTRTEVDHERVLNTSQGVLKNGIAVPAREHLRGGLLIMIDGRKLAEGLEAIRIDRVVFTY